MRCAQLLTLLALSLAPVGCSTTSGQDWVNSPLEVAAPPPLEVTVATESTVAPRPRLQHSVTLGESYTGSSPALAAPGEATGVQVNVHTHVPVTINNYGSYGYAVVDDTTPRARTTRSAPLQPGQDFPSLPNHGPQFPYRTGPASPWAR